MEYIIDKENNSKKEQEEQIKATGGEIEETPEPLTLKEIMSDKEKSSLFVKMLDNDGGQEYKDLLARLTSSKLEEADVDALSNHRKKFEVKMQRVENVKGQITEEVAIELAERNPDIKKLLENVGADSIVGIVQERLGDLSVTEPERFNKLAKNIESMQSFQKGKFKELQNNVEKMCTEKNLDGGEYLKALAIEDPDEREKALVSLVRDSWGDGCLGKSRRFLDLLSFKAFSANGTLKLDKKKPEVDAIFQELDKKKKSIGKILVTTIKGSDDMREALAKSILGEFTKKEQFGFKDAKSVPQIKPEEIQKRWEDTKAEGFSGPGGNKSWDEMSTLEQDSARDYFLEDIKTEQASKRKGGIWNLILGSIFEVFLLDQKKDLK